MSNPLKLHFMLYMFHAHQATYSNSTKFVLKRSDDCDYVIYAVPPMREIPCFMYHPGYPSGLVKVHGIPL